MKRTPMPKRKTKRGISAFNRAKNPLYGAKRIWLYDDKISKFVKAFYKSKGVQVDDSTNC